MIPPVAALLLTSYRSAGRPGTRIPHQFDSAELRYWAHNQI